MKNLLINSLLIIIILLGFVFLLYPTVSNWLQTGQHEIQMETYRTDVNGLSKSEIEAEWQKAAEYNNSLLGTPVKDPFVPGSGMALPKNYHSVLNINGIIGYINIPSIGVYLPIYHGTEEEVLLKGVGHIESTGFPIGRENLNPVLSAHTGLPSAKLFTDLIDVQLGDTFSIHILDKTLYYKVDQIKVILPDDTKQLVAVKGKDYVTLLTCTPLGVNDHRLIVRGERCYEIVESLILDAENIFIWIGLLACSGLFTLMLLLLIISRSRKIDRVI